jgi:ParB family transcriptional regulator, chromosome partitioning protein
MPSVDINRIKIDTNRRPANSDKVAELIESIRTNGLINPITLDKDYNLVAGLHRLTAYQSLGYKKIECSIVSYKDRDSARLAEIDENLIRNEVEGLERDELWLERDRILERLGLRAKSGDNQYRQQGGETISSPLRTTLELAKEVGYTERTFQYGKQIARDILPEVKKKIEGTLIANSTSARLKIARAGKQERQEAERAEQAAQEAMANQKLAEAEQQKKLVAEARAKQTKLQLAVFENILAEMQAKQTAKQLQRKAIPSSQEPLANKEEQIEVQAGSEWLLNRHLVYCGDTVDKDFREKLPSHASLALVLPSIPWKHDYLIDEARVVTVLRSEGYIHDFCRRCQMPFKFELLVGGIYVAICSHSDPFKPNPSINIEGIEGIVDYLVNFYSKPGNFVIAPSLGQGEVLIACERLGRICFIGDDDPKRVNHAICRWQQWTGKQAQKV